MDESAHHALVNTGEGNQKGSARGSVHWGCYYDTALDIEVDPQRCCFGSRQSDFDLQAVVECRMFEPECFRVVGLRSHSSGSGTQVTVGRGVHRGYGMF